MAYDLKSLIPVYLPKPMTPDENPEDYKTAITQNEDGINQNFTELANALLDMQERLKAYEEG